ncbi:ABC transporter permease subunit [Microbacterium hatanonis]|uniref:ABC transporter permease subunit n=1 Tax=Microbacterium hatanonis TaxID=404366 RepID=A0A5C8HVX9_9MICO|nr:ABC transporter permease subunit [Microbacterium hatanonis]TXK10253.1 ABC transporter permease subunit [Microbacterium hatanonis]
MSTSTPTPVFTPTGRDLSFGGVVASEWIKFRSIRSTWWCFAILVVLTVGFSLLLSASLSVDPAPTGDSAQSLSVQAVTISTTFGALVVSVLGVLIISGEYGTGMIRSTLTAVPKRTPALLAKALVFAIATFVVAVISFGISIAVSVALLSGKGLETDLADPQYWLAILGGVGYLVLVGLIAFSLGAIIRNTAGSVAVALGLVLAAPIVLNIVGVLTQLVWMQNLEKILPSSAGSALAAYPVESSGGPTTEGLWTIEPWAGGLILVAWVVVLFSTAIVLLKRRDA